MKDPHPPTKSLSWKIEDAAILVADISGMYVCMYTRECMYV